MKTCHPTKVVWLLIPVTVFLLLLTAYSTQTANATPSLSDQITTAWQRAQQSERFSYRGLVEQTTYPQPSIRNVGAQPRQRTMGMEGDVDVSAETMTLSLWSDASFNPDTALAVRVANGESFARQGTQQWQRVDGITDLFAPGGDPLSFLSGVRNVQLGERQTQPFGDTLLSATQYTFDLDSTAFADHMRREMERQLRERGQLPPGMHLSSSEVYRQMTGQGELWIDANGLPRRMVIELEIPASAEIERTTATITHNYDNFDLTQLGLINTPFQSAPTIWIVQRLPVQTLTLIVVQFIALFTLALLCVRYWQTRAFYRLFAWVNVAALVFVPLLNARSVSAFQQETQARQVESAARQAEADMLAEQRAAANTTYWQPNTPAVDQLQPATQMAMASVTLSGGTDTDGDGIADVDETDFFLTDPNSADTDNDGLTDDIELFVIGTAARLADSDGDSINDGDEIAGFSYFSKTWYLNPLEPDSNKDGLPDGAECFIRVADNPDYDPAAICPDSDGNGVIDAFDDDNDDDGVVDQYDLNPNTHGGVVFSADSPLELTLNNLAVDEPVILDLQMRPTHADNLSLMNAVYDWPLDEAGQITRFSDSTFADTTNLSAQSSSANASYGEVRITPVLEIIIPGRTGHYGNLPVNTTYMGQDRPQNVLAETWLDATAYAPYGIGVTDITTGTAANDLAVYVPIVQELHADSGTAVAFKARMPYFPSQATTGDPSIADWGSDHTYNLVWLVQMLSDECINAGETLPDCDKQDVMRTIHVYRETWTLTGLSISEERGTDVAIIYEDPVRDSDTTLDDQLWLAADGLSRTFLRGRDVDDNNERDVRIDNLETSLNDWYGDLDNYALAVEPIVGQLESSEQLSRVMITDTVTLLNDTFSAQHQPTLLFAQENTERRIGLNGGGLSGTLFTGDFDEVVTTTRVSLSWKPYQYVGGAWVNADIESYLDNLDYLLSAIVFVADDEMTQAELTVVEGKRIWAQMFYAALYQGLGNVVESAETVLFEASELIPETGYNPERPPTTFYGTAYVAALAAATFAAAFNGLKSGAGFFTGFANGLSKSTTATFGRADLFTTGYERVGDLSPRMHLGAFAIDILLAAIIIAAVIGTIMFFTAMAEGNEKLMRRALLVLNAVALAALTVHLITVVTAITRMIMVFTGALSVLLTAFNTLNNFVRGSPAFGAFTFLLQVGSAWGMFLFQLLGVGFDGNAIAKGYALATAVAQTIIALVLLVVQGLGQILAVLVSTVFASSGIGTILLLIFFIVDVILFFAGEKTITERWTEAIADTLYDVDYVLSNFGSGDRLDFQFNKFEPVNPDLGFSAANGFVPVMSITNTIEYRKNSNDNQAKRTVMQYTLQYDTIDQHGDLPGNSMRSDWQALPGRALQYATVITPTQPYFNPLAGLNRNFPNIYVTEAYAVPYEGCWTIGSTEVDCDWEYLKGSNHLEVGRTFLLDILPATVEEFVDFDAWESPIDENGGIEFPVQYDADNDGLINRLKGGADPDDADWDSDDDGISDFREIELGTDPLNADTDGDNLSDADELRFATDPNDDDSDDDGLNDYVETNVGWLSDNGDGGVMRVWSHPHYRDADDDKLDDLREYTFGFNPNVTTDPNAIGNVVQIGNFDLRESAAPLFRLDFDDIDVSDQFTSNTFVDSNDSAWSATCDDCPMDGVTGRYGYAVAFDGVDDVIAVRGGEQLEMSADSWSIGLWIKTNTTDNVTLFSRHDNDGDFDLGESRLTIFSGQLYYDYQANFFITSPLVDILDDEWHHVMMTYDSGERVGDG